LAADASVYGVRRPRYVQVLGDEIAKLIMRDHFQPGDGLHIVLSGDVSLTVPLCDRALRSIQGEGDVGRFPYQWNQALYPVRLGNRQRAERPAADVVPGFTHGW
jgi:hypothetical protein